MSLPTGTITTQKFFYMYYPPSLSTKMRNDITSFVQGDHESLHKAWERYKEMLRKCPHHCLPVWMQVETFYAGLLPNVQTMVDVVAR